MEGITQMRIVGIELAIFRNGRITTQVWKPELEENDIIRNLSLFHHAEPILSVPFYFHDDVKYLHTMCTRIGDITQIER
jgi:hypothetical protein